MWNSVRAISNSLACFSVGSKLRVETYSPFTSAKRERNSSSKSILKSNRKSGIGVLDASDAVDDEVFDATDTALLVEMGMGSGNSYDAIANTTTRRLSWSVTVDQLEGPQSQDGESLTSETESAGQSTELLSAKESSSTKRRRSIGKDEISESGSSSTTSMLPPAGKKSRMQASANSIASTGEILTTLKTEKLSEQIPAAAPHPGNVAGNRRRGATASNGLSSLFQ